MIELSSESSIHRKRLHGHLDEVACLAIGNADQSPVLFSGSEDKTVRIWDYQRSSQAVRCVLTDGAVNAIASCKSHPFNLYVCSASSVLCFDLRVPNVVLKEFAWKADCKTPAEVSSSPADVEEDEVNAISFHKKGGSIAAVTDSGNLCLFDIPNNSSPKAGASQPKIRAFHRTHENIATSVIFRNCRPSEILSGGLDGLLIRWDMLKGRPINKCSLSDVIHESSMTLDDDEQSIAASIQIRAVNPPWIHSLSESENGVLIGCGLQNGDICVLDSQVLWGQSRTLKSTSSKTAAFPHQSSIRAMFTSVHNGPITSLAFCQKGSLVLSGSAGDDMLIALWQLPETTIQNAGLAPVQNPRIKLANHSRINTMCIMDSGDDCALKVAVGDQTRDVSILSFR